MIPGRYLEVCNTNECGLGITTVTRPQAEEMCELSPQLLSLSDGGFYFYVVRVNLGVVNTIRRSDVGPTLACMSPTAPGGMPGTAELAIAGGKAPGGNPSRLVVGRRGPLPI